METPLLTITAIAAVGLLYVLLPVAADTYRRYGRRRVVTCPETHGLAEIRIDASYAARSALVGAPALRVNACTRWPERKGCPANCISEE
ncbi:MAG TPA: hypothetical protein VL754_17080 [Verrucomicrobiae bacterium]|jgi:hypothetical protein|nr:hypothetical protein [Verrucomicrobiae bacterium]